MDYPYLPPTFRDLDLRSPIKQYYLLDTLDADDTASLISSHQSSKDRASSVFLKSFTTLFDVMHI